MEEREKPAYEPIYNIDHDYMSDFSEFYGADFLSKTSVKNIWLDHIGNADFSEMRWTMEIEQGTKLGDVLTRIPCGVIHKTITGLGATTLELVNQTRDSIIVVPTKSLAYNKYMWANN